ncbi:MAG TPA: DUF4349 domain-containing protein [Blastocatellia bacterium]|nr:DUF4349 domain-containing protein [Blastocatellia bacterium]
MRYLLITGVVCSLILCCSCAEEKPNDHSSRSAPANATPQAEKPAAASLPQATNAVQEFVRSRPVPARHSGDNEDNSGPPVVSDAEQATLSVISTVQASTQASDRKIIRDANLTIETDSPTEGLRQITAIAENNGGFIVTSDLKQNDGGTQARATQTVTVIARIPASRFETALSQIHSFGGRVINEKVSGQDVSEEYLDLEARLRTKKALEAQFLEIMKQARKVTDALEVQSQLGEVRTEIERLEGRRRFLENQAALSTITITLQMPQPIIAASTTGFGTTIKRAFGDAVDTAASIVLFVIQAVIVLVPITIFFGLPLWLIWRVVRRRIPIRKPEPSPIPSK